MDKKTKGLFITLMALMMCFVCNETYAYDIAVENAAGVTIYYNYTNNGTELEVTYRNNDYKSYSGTVNIPETVTYMNRARYVTSIGEKAFYRCSGLISVTIPNSVTSIGNEAFYYCYSRTVTYNYSATSKRSSTSSSCSGLTSVTIGNSVTSIGDAAFQYCSSLTSVVIPDGVTSIGESAFQYCSDLISITIPNSVTSIGGYAFHSCRGLTSITIPNSVTSIGKMAFSDCSGLASINVEEGNTKFDSRDNCNAIIETSSNTLIAGCKSSTIPSSVTSIGDYAFLYCSSLTSITIPESVTSIGDAAFAGCSGLTSINVEEGNTKYDSRDNCNAIIETSSNTLIAGCKNSTIPGNVTSIGGGAFRGCSGLTSVTIPGSVTSIGSSAFSGCSGLTSVTIPESVTSIGNEAFFWCRGLTSITILSSVTSIGDHAFLYCTGLTSINVEKGNTKYDSRDNCNAIIETSSNTLITGCKNSTIPSSVTSIGDYAFYECSGLTSITIPNSVTQIGENAFSNCHGLTDVICMVETVPNTDSNAFANLSFIKHTTLHVPRTAIDAYKSTDPWSTFKEIVALTD